MLELLSTKFELWEIVAEGDHSIDAIRGQFDDAASSYDMKFQLHAPLSDINIASVNPNIREISIRHIIAAIKFANDVGIDMVTIHPGHLSPLGVLCPDKVSETNKVSLKSIDGLVREWGVQVAVENMPKAWNTFCLDIGELLDAIEGTELEVCYDIGHGNTAGTTQSFLEHPERIINIHAHDNTGKFDAHMAIGDGSIDFSSIFKELAGYDGNVIIESRGFESGAVSLQKLLKMGQ
jgi:sugar phosphate isomerase/epimerase